MGLVVQGVEQFMRKTQTLTRSMPLANQKGLSAAAFAIERSILAAAAGAGAHPQPNWAIHSRVPATAGGEAVSIRLHTARAYWAQRGTQPHTIQPRSQSGRGRKRGTAQVLKLKDGSYRAYVDHPGAKAHPFWAAGVAAGMGPARDVMSASIVRSLRESFGS